MKRKIYILVFTDYKDKYETNVWVFDTFKDARKAMETQYKERLAQQDLTRDNVEYNYSLGERTATIREENLWDVYLDWSIEEREISVGGGNNAKYYIDKGTPSEGGKIYKAEDFDVCGDDDVIYIGELGFSDLQTFYENGGDVTDAEIVEYYGSSKNSIRQELIANGYTEEEIEKENLVAAIFEMCTGLCSSTEILNMAEIRE